jgi:nucleoside-diphosphate-sugar epimerase
MLCVLVLGGYGFFGARIAKALAPDTRLRVLIGGRDPQRPRATSGSRRSRPSPSMRMVEISLRDSTSYVSISSFTRRVRFRVKTTMSRGPASRQDAATSILATGESSSRASHVSTRVHAKEA